MELLEPFQIYLKSLLSDEDGLDEWGQRCHQRWQTLCLLQQ